MLMLTRSLPSVSARLAATSNSSSVRPILPHRCGESRGPMRLCMDVWCSLADIHRLPAHSANRAITMHRIPDHRQHQARHMAKAADAAVGTSSSNKDDVQGAMLDPSPANNLWVGPHLGTSSSSSN